MLNIVQNAIIYAGIPTTIISILVTFKIPIPIVSGIISIGRDFLRYRKTWKLLIDFRECRLETAGQLRTSNGTFYIDVLIMNNTSDHVVITNVISIPNKCIKYLDTIYTQGYDGVQEADVFRQISLAPFKDEYRYQGRTLGFLKPDEGTFKLRLTPQMKYKGCYELKLHYEVKTSKYFKKRSEKYVIPL